jgi:NAD-dependent SIR2 family protein deacetylase
MVSIKEIRGLFSNFKCSDCGAKFGSDCIQLVRDESDGLVVLHFRCQNCTKSFGVAFLGLNGEDLANSTEQEAPAIDFDDILDAHKCIENLEDNWQKFIAKKDS